MDLPPMIQRSIRVLHVTEVLAGGVATYLNHLLPWQSQHYGVNQVALIAPEEELEHLSASARSGVRVFPYVRKNRRPLAWWRLSKMLGRAVRAHEPSVIHAHSSFAGAIVRISSSAMTAAPIIYCAHGWSFDMERPFWQRQLFASIERRLASRTAAIIAISEHDKTSAVQYGIPVKFVQRIYYGLHDMPPSSRQPADENSPLQLLFVGRLDRQKGLDWLLNCMATLPANHVCLTVVGAVVSDHAHAFRTLPGVRYTGWIPHEKLNDFYDASDAVIMPSRWEGFGLVAAEAMRRGIPVLVSDRGGLPEVIGLGEAGKVFALDTPEQLRHLLWSVKRAELHRLGQQGRARFLRLFTAERMNHEVDQAYKRVLSESQ